MKIKLENVIFFTASLRYAQAHLVSFLPFGRWTVWLPEHQGSQAVQSSGVTDNGQSDAIFFMPLAGVEEALIRARLGKV